MEIIERLSAGRTSTRAPHHPSGLDYAVRWNRPRPYGEGYEDGFVIGDDFIVTAIQTKVRRRFEETEPGLGRLIFLFHLSGRRIIGFPGHGDYDLDLPSLSIIQASEGIPRCNTWIEGGPEKSVAVSLNPRQLPLVLPQTLTSVMAPLVWSDRKPGVSWRQLPLSPEMEAAARATLWPGVHPKLMRDYLTAKARELICLALDGVLACRSAAVRDQEAGRRQFLKVADYVDRNVHRKITMAQIAADVGARPAKVSEWFAQYSGMSMQEYCAHSRLTKACYLLLSTDRPLKQIAFETGYNHTANLCIAFKKRFGLTPSQARARERSPSPAG